MKYLKLFEEFEESMYELKKPLPKEGIIEVKDDDELLALILHFEKEEFENVPNEDMRPRAYLKKDWNLDPGKHMSFQWTSDRRVFFFSESDKDRERSRDLAPDYEFEDYFQLKHKHRGHKLKKRYGV